MRTHLLRRRWSIVSLDFHHYHSRLSRWNERLKQSLAEKMSFFVIGVAVVAMLTASLENLNLITVRSSRAKWAAKMLQHSSHFLWHFDYCPMCISRNTQESSPSHANRLCFSLWIWMETRPLFPDYSTGHDFTRCLPKPHESGLRISPCLHLLLVSLQ